jgi:tRNA threonylcarbamoyladenosine biosynthesis protein TsaB
LKILALESSAKAASVAVTEDDVLIAQYFQDSGLTHSRTLLKMSEDLLNNTEIALRDISVIAVAAGPGSFTGVRIGVAAAKGLAWGAGLPVRGVSTLKAMAYSLEAEDKIICAVMDARRGEVYNAKFIYKKGELTRLCEDRAIPVSLLLKEAAKETAPYLLVGDGAKLAAEAFETAGAAYSLPPRALRLQSACGVALAALRAPSINANDLVPNYLRVSQAERLAGLKGTVG